MHDDTAATSRILVWDLPVRLFHWMLAISFAVLLAVWEKPDPETFWRAWRWMDKDPEAGRYGIRSTVVEDYLATSRPDGAGT